MFGLSGVGAVWSLFHLALEDMTANRRAHRAHAVPKCRAARTRLLRPRYGWGCPR